MDEEPARGLQGPLAAEVDKDEEDEENDDDDDDDDDEEEEEEEEEEETAEEASEAMQELLGAVLGIEGGLSSPMSASGPPVLEPELKVGEAGRRPHPLCPSSPTATSSSSSSSSTPYNRLFGAWRGVGIRDATRFVAGVPVGAEMCSDATDVCDPRATLRRREASSVRWWYDVLSDSAAAAAEEPLCPAASTCNILARQRRIPSCLPRMAMTTGVASPGDAKARPCAEEFGGRDDQ